MDVPNHLVNMEEFNVYPYKKKEGKAYREESTSKEILEFISSMHEEYDRFYDILDDEGNTLESLKEITAKLGVKSKNINKKNTPSVLSRDYPFDTKRNQLVIAFAKNKKAWKWIDKIYDENRYAYYKAYKQTFYVNCKIKDIFSSETKLYIEKMAGIDAWCRLNSTEAPLLKLIQKTNNALYSLFKGDIKGIDLDAFIKNKYGKNMKTKQNAENKVYALEQKTSIAMDIIISLYLSQIFRKEYIKFGWNEILDGYLNELFSPVDAAIANMLVVNSLYGENHEMLIREFFGVEYKLFKKCKNLCEFFKLITASQLDLVKKTSEVMMNIPVKIAPTIDEKKDFEKLLRGENLDDIIDEKLSQAREMASKRIHSTETSKIVTNITASIKFRGINSDEILVDMPINDNIVLSSIALVCEQNIFDIVLGDMKISTALRNKVIDIITIISMTEKYKQQRASFFKDNDEIILEQVNELNSKLEEKDLEIEMLKKQIEENNKTNKEKVDALISELELSDKNYKKLEKELLLANEKDKEFNAMKDFVYRNSNTEIKLEEDSVNLETMVKYLNSKDIMVFGGHPNWVNKLKKHIPDAKYIDVDRYSSQKFNRLDKYDLLTICTNYIDHGLIYKIGEAIKNVESKKVVMVNGINMNTVISDMYNSLSEFEENNN